MLFRLPNGTELCSCRSRGSLSVSIPVYGPGSGYSEKCTDTPVFQITYTYQNKNLFQFPLDTPTLGEIEFVEEIGQEGEFKLSLEVYEEKDHFVLCFKYDANQFDAEDIKSMMNHYQILLASNGESR